MWLLRIKKRLSDLRSLEPKSGPLWGLRLFQRFCGRHPALRPHPSQAEFTSTPNRVWKCEEDLAVFRQEYDQDMGLWEELEASPPFVHKTLSFMPQHLTCALRSSLGEGMHV